MSFTQTGLMTSPGRGPKTANKGGPRPPLKIESRIGIQARPDDIWEILSDLSSWPEWSKIYPQIAGEIRIGARLQVAAAIPGLPEREFTARVVDWIPYEQIIWSDLPFRGWGKSMRFFEIEQLDDAACIFSNGEVFRGWLSEKLASRRRRAYRAGFDLMSESLKARAEALYKSRT